MIWIVDAVDQGAEAKPLQPVHAIHGRARTYLEIREERDLHVYVLNEDEEGQNLILFPGPVGRNPLKGGQHHRIPSLLGEDYVWEFSEEGGTETILFIASTEPLPSLEVASLKELGFGYPPLERETLDHLLATLRGATLKELADTGDTRKTRFIDNLVSELVRDQNHRRTIWFRKYRIEKGMCPKR